MKFLFQGHSADLQVQLGTWEGDIIISVKILKYKQVITVLVEGEVCAFADSCLDLLWITGKSFFLFFLFFFFFLKEDI